DGNGIELAQTVTDDGGEFRFSADFTADGIYFVATRYDNVIYVGIPFHPPGPPEGEYVVLVGDPSMGLQLGGPLPEEAMLPDRPADLPLAGIAFAVLTLAGFLTLAWRDGARGNWRRDVLRLAELEEAYADGQDDTVPEAERDLYEKRRQQLWEQLLRRTGAG
ncbi:MAG TPA: hypothetical protein VNZ57_15145, partial [Longimicrobiales bacterium]|nr:hypothetical protein [Longimicrobiales bacterium]